MAPIEEFTDIPILYLESRLIPITDRLNFENLIFT